MADGLTVCNEVLIQSLTAHHQALLGASQVAAGNLVAYQQAMQQLLVGATARATGGIMNAGAVATESLFQPDIAEEQVRAKVAQSTPPETAIPT